MIIKEEQLEDAAEHFNGVYLSQKDLSLLSQDLKGRIDLVIVEETAPNLFAFVKRCKKADNQIKDKEEQYNNHFKKGKK